MEFPRIIILPYATISDITRFKTTTLISQAGSCGLENSNRLIQQFMFIYYRLMIILVDLVTFPVVNLAK
jgi:hypothetical protein